MDAIKGLLLREDLLSLISQLKVIGSSFWSGLDSFPSLSIKQIQTDCQMNKGFSK